MEVTAKIAVARRVAPRTLHPPLVREFARNAQPAACRRRSSWLRVTQSLQHLSPHHTWRSGRAAPAPAASVAPAVTMPAFC